MEDHKLPKSERMHSRKLIDGLFQGNGRGRAMTAFPLRLVFKPAPEGRAADGNTADGTSEESSRRVSQMFVSVPKRHLKHAVDRNRVKRQVREAYRLNKHVMADTPSLLAFIWLDDKLWPTAEVGKRVANLLNRAAEKAKSVTTRNEE